MSVYYVNVYRPKVYSEDPTDKGFPLTPSSNFKVDDMATFLSKYGAIYSQSPFQYLKPQYEMDIKIDMGQINMIPAYSSLCYVSIASQQTATTPLYYFITRMEWASEKAIRLHLVMDVLNSFNKGESVPLVSPKTTIHRQHEDRFELRGGWGEEHLIASVNDDADALIEDDTYYLRVTQKMTGLPQDADATFQITTADVKINGGGFYDQEDLDHLEVLPYNYYGDGYWYVVVRWVITAEDYDRVDDELVVNVYGKTEYVTPKHYAVIDPNDEGIHPVLVKTSEALLPQVAGESWNLIYRNDDNIDETAYNQDNPVTCSLVPDHSLPIEYQGGAGAFAPNDIPSDYTQFPIEKNNGQEYFITYSGNEYHYRLSWLYTGGAHWAYLAYIPVLHRSGSVLNIDIREVWKTRGGEYSYGGPIRTFSGVTGITFVNAPANIYYYNQATDFDGYKSTSNGSLPVGALISSAVKGVTDIDRKDAKLIKIIKLPLPPSPWENTGSGYYFSGWTYDAGDRIYNLASDTPIFDYKFLSSLDNPLAYLKGQTLTIGIADRFMEDPKLKASEFYRPSFVYDSFNFDWALERVDSVEWNKQAQNKLPIRFVTSSTFNSKFAFIFEDYILKYGLGNYENVLPISRNNELPIFTSQYVNYLRTAYRYDLKNVQRSKVSSAIQGLGAVAGGVMGAFTGNALAVGGAVFGVVNAIMGAQRAEEGLKSKLAQMEAQAVGVGNADDIDLLMAYSNNQAKLCIYEPLPNMKHALDDLFYYCGYAVEKSGIPNENSRIWFNFVQADMVFYRNKACPDWAIEKLKEKYREGVTILHKFNGEYNPEQTKENWERALYE